MAANLPTIEYLANHRQHVPLIGHWVWSEWERHNGKTEQFCIDEIEHDGCFTDRLNLTLIALLGNECIGTIQLMKEDCLENYADLGPWLGNFYVTPSSGRNWIAVKLFKAILKQAKNMGFAEVYMHTTSLQTAALRYKAEFIGKDVYIGRSVDIFRFPVTTS